VSDPTGEYALKVEGVNEQIQVLKMEVFVLSELAKRGGRHFCKIEDKGRYGSFNFVVMTLVGKSLQDLRKVCLILHTFNASLFGKGPLNT
jgi:tau tubulin kinase